MLLRLLSTTAMRRTILSLALLAATPFVALAHEIWIEDTPEGQLVVRFAEYGDEYEKSPGALDSVTLPFAWTPGVADEKAPEGKPDAASGAPSGEARAIRAGRVESFDVKKAKDGFFLEKAQPAQPVQVETGFTVMGKAGDPEKPARKPYFYARWQPVGSAPATPGLNFDIVPTGKQGEACVYFRGKPLAGVKVKLYPPAEAEQELTSDEAGIVRFSSTKPGLYLLSAGRQRETIPGFFGGKPFDVTSHNCSLSWRQP